MPITQSARSQVQSKAAPKAFPILRKIVPGVYDIHSHNIPTQEDVLQ